MAWRVGVQGWADEDRRLPIPPLHAVADDGTVACGYEGRVEVQDLPWSEWGRLTIIDGPGPCPECALRAPL